MPSSVRRCGGAMPAGVVIVLYSRQKEVQVKLYLSTYLPIGLYRQTPAMPSSLANSWMGCRRLLISAASISNSWQSMTCEQPDEKDHSEQQSKPYFGLLLASEKAAIM